MGNKALARFSDELARCSGCGQCIAVCPTWEYSRDERQGPRGRLALIRAWVAGRVNSDALIKPIETCLQCGRCDAACPAGIPLNRIFFALRRHISLPVSSRARLLSRLLSTKPEALDFMQPLAHMGMRAGNLFSGNIPALAFNPWSMKRAPDKHGTKIILYTGCIARRLLPRLASACVQALKSNGYQPLAFSSLPCCGRPQAMQGQAILGAVRKSLAIIKKENCWLLTSPCPACIDTIRNIWPNAQGLTDAERKTALRIADKAATIDELSNGFALDKADISAGLPGKLLWHKPCLLDDEAPSLRLLATRPNLEVVLGQDPLACCGSSLQCLDQGRKMAGESKDFALAILGRAFGNSCQGIITSCPGCMQILEKQQKTHALPVWHAVEIYIHGRKAIS